MTASMKCAIVLALIFPVQTFSSEIPLPRASRFEVQQSLFGGSNPGVMSPALVSAGEAPKKKTTGLAAIYSLLLPGMGELYADNFASGKYFLIAEGALWLTYATFEVYGNQLRDDSRAYATAHAGVTVAGKSDQYFVDIGNFINTDEYNQKKLRDRDYLLVYNDPGYAWQWDSPLSRATFRDQRIGSENMYNNRKFVVAAILVNHVASAINAVRATILYNKSLNDAVGDLEIHAGVLGNWMQPQGIVLTLSRKF